MIRQNHPTSENEPRSKSELISDKKIDASKASHSTQIENINYLRTSSLLSWVSLHIAFASIIIIWFLRRGMPEDSSIYFDAAILSTFFFLLPQFINKKNNSNIFYRSLIGVIFVFVASCLILALPKFLIFPFKLAVYISVLCFLIIKFQETFDFFVNLLITFVAPIALIILFRLYLEPLSNRNLEFIGSIFTSINFTGAYEFIVLTLYYLALLFFTKTWSKNRIERLYIGILATLVTLHVFHIYIEKVSYLHPFIQEKLLSNTAFRDPAFHIAQIASLKNFGIPSTAIDGLVYIHYHYGQHILAAGFAKIFNHPPSFAYLLNTLVVGIPLFFTSIVSLCFSIFAFLRRNSEENPFALSLLSSVPAFYFIISDYHKSTIISDSSLFGSAILFLFSATIIENSFKNSSKLDGKSSETQFFFVLGISCIVITIMKVSAGYCAFIIYFIFLFRNKNVDIKKRLLAIFLVGGFIVLSTALFFNRKSTAMNIENVDVIETILKFIKNMIVVNYGSFPNLNISIFFAIICFLLNFIILRKNRLRIGGFLLYGSIAIFSALFLTLFDPHLAEGKSHKIYIAFPINQLAICFYFAFLVAGISEVLNSNNTKNFKILSLILFSTFYVIHTETMRLKIFQINIWSVFANSAQVFYPENSAEIIKDNLLKYSKVIDKKTTAAFINKHQLLPPKDELDRESILWVTSDSDYFQKASCDSSGFSLVGYYEYPLIFGLGPKRPGVRQCQINYFKNKGYGWSSYDLLSAESIPYKFKESAISKCKNLGFKKMIIIGPKNLIENQNCIVYESKNTHNL